jgi:hypothetical protein
MDQDAIACWIKSVKEAKLAQLHVETVTKYSILQFLWPCGKEVGQTKPVSSEDGHNHLLIAQAAVTATKSFFKNLEKNEKLRSLPFFIVSNSL